MSTLPETISLASNEEAARLWETAVRLEPRAREDVVALCELLELGLHAVEIRIVDRLQDVKSKFPATIALQLELPEPDVDAYRDAVTVPRALQFGDMIDLLSQDSLQCVAPRLHRGWEDRRFSCRRSRHTAREALGVELDDTGQQHLLLLAAYRNRIFRYPPPVSIRPAAILDAFAALRGVMERIG